ncbi:MAG: hypothetical protein V4707_02255 [Pseudomonadota bacterium]
MSSTLLIALAALAVQTAPPPAPSPAYRDPPVRPFEPAGPLVTGAEAEAGFPPLRHPPEAPVSVDAYRGHYEAPPDAVERAYDRGVNQAETAMNSRMGPLDGRWRVLDQGGGILFTLVLSDEGSGVPIEGAWRDDGGHMGVAASTPRDDGRTVIVLDGRCELVLAPSGSGFTGALIREGREQPVRLSRT